MSNSAARSVNGVIVIVSWLITFVLAYFLLSEFIGLTAEGVDMMYRPKLGLTLTGIMTLISIGLTIAWARGLGATTQADSTQIPSSGRRQLLLGATGTVAGLAGTLIATLVRQRGWIETTLQKIVWPEVPHTHPKDEHSHGHPQWSGRIRGHRRLGRTDFMVSDISLGAGRIHPQKGGTVLARKAIERGVNYIDTAPDYSETGSERAVGLAIKGYREHLFIASKFCTPHGHLGPGASVQEYMATVEGSLKRLETDYLDLVHIHSCDNVKRLLDENAHEAFDRLKEQGKVRFLGVSTHTPNLETVADAAINSDRFDVMMLAYHHGAWPKLGEIIHRAAAKDIGIVAMKTLKGAKHEGLIELRAKADTYSQAAFKWVLSNPDVSCLVISMFKPQHIDEYLHASGKTDLTEADQMVLREYDQLIAGKHCFQHCGECLDVCPEQLRIDDVLRYRMYFEDYGDEKEALRLYSKLGKQADACLGCSAPCLGSCPHGIQIQERMLGAHDMLTLS